MKKTVILSLLILSWNNLTAADASESRWALRLQVNLLPGVTSTEYEAPIDAERSETWDANGAEIYFCPIYRLKSTTPHSAYFELGTFINGFEGTRDNLENPTSPPDGISIDSYGFKIGGGYSCRVNKHYLIDFGPTVGFGGSVVHRDEIREFFATETGRFVSTEIALNNYFIYRRFNIGCNVGLSKWTSTIWNYATKQPEDGVFTTYSHSVARFTGQGVKFGLSLGMSF